MKRVWIVVGLLILIIATGAVSILHLHYVTTDMIDSLDQFAVVLDKATGGTGKAPPPEGDGADYTDVKLSTQVGAADQQEMTRLASSFQRQWEKDETVLMHYIHHDELDSITATVARLQALARYGAIPELAAEVDRLRHLILHIYESQLPLIKNLL